MRGLIVKILLKIYKTPLILLHAARLKTWLTDARPAVDLSWKALVYSMSVSSSPSVTGVRQSVSQEVISLLAMAIFKLGMLGSQLAPTSINQSIKQ